MEASDLAGRFDTAKFFTHDGGEERLSHTDPDEAIQAHFAGWETDLEEYLAQHAPLTIYAYNPRVIDGKAVTALALDLQHRLVEAIDDEYGGEDHECFDGEERADLLTRLLGVVQIAAQTCRVWACAQVAEREYTADELREILS